MWLIGDLTDWDAAATILGIAAGMPALLISAQAGLLVDRISPRKFGMPLLVVTTVCFAGAAAIASSSLNSVPTALASAFVCAFPIAATTPLYQALVPLIVPKQRILQAVALQNMGSMVALMVGGGMAGVLIDRFDTPLRSGSSLGSPWQHLLSSLRHRSPTLPSIPARVASSLARPRTTHCELNRYARSCS